MHHKKNNFVNLLLFEHNILIYFYTMKFGFSGAGWDLKWERMWDGGKRA